MINPRRVISKTLINTDKIVSVKRNGPLPSKVGKSYKSKPISKACQANRQALAKTLKRK